MILSGLERPLGYAYQTQMWIVGARHQNYTAFLFKADGFLAVGIKAMRELEEKLSSMARNDRWVKAVLNFITVLAKRWSIYCTKLHFKTDSYDCQYVYHMAFVLRPCSRTSM